MSDATFTEPFDRFAAWFAEAQTSEPNDPNAMVLTTATAQGKPSARAVLMKDWDRQGFVFYTNLQSRKGTELLSNRQACLLFYWKVLHRQVRIDGRVEDVTREEADAYYTSRPRGSRIGAHASDQSRPLPDRAVLEARIAEAERRFPGEDIPRPAHWSGFRVVPEAIEFWQDMPFRLHDRTLFTRAGTGWAVQKLFP